MISALQTVLSPEESLPRAFEASEKWPNLIHEPLDQGNCAGSWAFSTAGTQPKDRCWYQGKGGLEPSPLTPLCLPFQLWHLIESPSTLWGT